jgi:uncharacterized Fe-S cluster-containing MiaB family protein
MKVELTSLESNGKLLIKKCHICGHVMESAKEVQKCQNCKKSFLPVNYFSKVHSKSQNDFSQLFASGHEIHEEDLIKGLTVLW